MTTTQLIQDTGFVADDYRGTPVPLAGGLPANATAIDLKSDAEVSDLSEVLEGLDMIRVDFPSSADGRGFTLARRLRQMGYQGRLRASGHVLADQYAMARRSGFDEVEIPADLAARQPEDQWLSRADWRAHDYQARLRG